MTQNTSWCRYLRFSGYFDRDFHAVSAVDADGQFLLSRFGNRVRLSGDRCVASVWRKSACQFADRELVRCGSKHLRQYLASSFGCEVYRCGVTDTITGLLDAGSSHHPCFAETVAHCS